MKLIIPALFLLIAVNGCKRSADKEFFGPLSVSGRVVDDVSGKPIAGARVSLDGMVQKSGPFGYMNEPEPLGTTLTDSGGNYQIKVKANGETSYSIYADGGPQYLKAAVAGTQDYGFKGSGDHYQDLRCFHPATAMVLLQNTGRKEPADLHISGPAGDARLDGQVRDTVIALKLVGNVSISSRVVYSNGLETPKVTDVHTAAGDTLHLRFEF